MHWDKEYKIFLTALWLFLICSLVLFIILISFDHFSLPLPVAVMFLLLDAGFIIFIFLPQPGRYAHGPDGDGYGRRRWYPTSLADIVERRKEPDNEHPGVRAPTKTVPPVPLVPLCLLFVVTLLALPLQPTEEEWLDGEKTRLAEVFRGAESELTGLGLIAERIGGLTSGMVNRFDLDDPGADERARIIHAVDSLAQAASSRIMPFREIGIQIISPGGDRVAWGGRPRFLRSGEPDTDSALVYIGRTQLYTTLVRESRLAGGGRVVVDIPLEVNYRINNRFLRSRSLGDFLSSKYDEQIQFSFALGEHGGRMFRLDESGDSSGPSVLYRQGSGVQVYGVVTASTALPLAGLRVAGEPYASMIEGREERRALWARMAVTLIAIAIALWGYRTYGKRYRLGRGRFWDFLKHVFVLVFILVVVRYLFLRLDVPSGFPGTNLFDPALFAGDVPLGLMRTAGDFLITSLFWLIFVFGTIKSFRTYYGGVLERRHDNGARFSLFFFPMKAVILAAVLIASLRLASTVVSGVVLNSNPTLIGMDIDYLSLPVIVIHLALLFTVSAVFIAVLFIFRLVFVWGRGGAGTGFASAAAALAAFAWSVEFQWVPIVYAAGLLVLSARIFSFIRKEEMISVVFSSFFLVLICSLVIYESAEGRYDELRRSRLIEKAQDFNFPEDNWIQVILPDICQEIANDKRIPSKVIEHRRSAAFEIWAESGLSRFNLSCAFDCYDSKGRHFSRFRVGLPFEPPPSSGRAAGVAVKPFVKDIRQETNEGAVCYYRGVVPVYHVSGMGIGRIEITLPYFFENPELLARTRSVAPEILQNVERGSLSPRIDEPRDLLVARIAGGRVRDSSSPLLVAGSDVAAQEGEWFFLELGGQTFRAVVMEKEPGEGVLVGYRAAGFLDNLLAWAVVVSIDIILTGISLLVLIIVRRLPVLGSVTPAISFSGWLGFRQKILLSFLAVSILPVVLLGIVSSQFIERRFGVEGENEALAGVVSAVSIIEHAVRSEAESFAGSQYLRDILGNVRDARIRDVALYETSQFALFGRRGEMILDESMSDFKTDEITELLDPANRGKLTVTYDFPHLFAGTVIPVSLPDGPGGFLYFRRRLDDGFIEGISGVLGKDINIFYRGLLHASSERDLFIGGFLDPIIEPSVYSRIALKNGKTFVSEASLGDYVYKVASGPIPPFRSLESGVLSVPMLYRPALVSEEIHKTSTLILGLLALLFAAAVTLGFFLAGKIFTPVAVLMGGTRRIIEGDLEFRLEARATDEIGELVESFNTMTGALRDARHDLVERQRYLAAILDNVATGVLATDSKGVIITLNPSGERILDLKRAEVLGKKPELIGRKGLEPLLGLISGAKDGRRVAEREVTLYSGDSKRTIKAVVASLREGDEMLGTVLVFDDLTELIRSKKLSAWIEMARQIAHEVKNPLTPIRLSVQLMHRAFEEQSEEFGEIFTSGVDTVIQQTDILRRIATEFSSFGKVTSLSTEAVPLDAFLAEFVGSYQGADNMEIVCERGERLSVMADREALRKICVNLMTNALEAMPDGGEVNVSYRPSGGDVEIVILDTGSGLPSEMREKLFEPYFSTKTTGTGLGLAISQSLAHEMDGEISLRNRAGGPGVEAVVRLKRAGRNQAGTRGS